MALSVVCGLAVTFAWGVLLRWGHTRALDEPYRAVCTWIENVRRGLWSSGGRVGWAIVGDGVGGGQTVLPGGWIIRAPLLKDSNNPFRRAALARAPVAIEKRQCIICLEDLSFEHFSVRSPTSACCHPPTVCTACLGAYLESHVNTRTPITCPTPLCPAFLQIDDVQRWASPSVFEKFETRFTRLKLSSTLGFMWCTNPSCDSGQFHSGNIVICDSCGAKSCPVHNVPWHSGLTCAEFDKELQRRARKKESDKLSSADKRYLRSHTKSCPKCGIAIQKNEGCDHMTCKPPGGCGYQFCWTCLADWKEIIGHGNHMHKRGCRFYRPLPGTTERSGSRSIFSFFRRRRSV